MRIMGFCLILVFQSFGEAQTKLAHFVAGEYELLQGPTETCGAGEFRAYNDEGPKVSFTASFIFDLRNFKELIEDDLDDTKKCFYEAQDSMDVLKQSTRLIFKETYKCGSLTKHILTRTAEITEGRIKMNVVQDGEPQFQYQCEWSIAKRKISSDKKNKTPKKK